MDDLKHLARALVSVLQEWQVGDSVTYKPSSRMHHGTPNDLEKARDIAHAILDGRKIHLDNAVPWTQNPRRGKYPSKNLYAGDFPLGLAKDGL